MKLIEIYRRFIHESGLKFKSSTNGEFVQFDFTDDGNQIGNINLRLKKGWNQLHIDIKDEYQRRGYAMKMISMIIHKYGHISIPEGRIVNPNMKKVIDQLSTKFDYYKTPYDEHIIYDGSKVKLNTIKNIFDN